MPPSGHIEGSTQPDRPVGAPDVRPGVVPGSSGAAPPQDPAPSRLPQWLQVMPTPRSHWTPRYVLDRVRVAWEQWRHPGEPWLTRAMVRLLEQHLKPEHVMVEFGSGRSTLWFARRVGFMVSIEHHAAWHAQITRELEKLPLRNWTYLLAGEDRAGYLAPATAHMAVARRAGGDGRADVILVDGIHRDFCALWALEHIRPGGLIVIDNANWFLPHTTRSPRSIGESGQPDGGAWQSFHDAVKGWRCVWTSNGVTDTAAYFAPVA